jgi:hypothetical protein
MCVSDACPQRRKLSFSQEPDNEPGTLSANAAIILGSELLIQPVNEMPLISNGQVLGIEKPELTCISEEGIADMDLPDNLLNDFDDGMDGITSSNRVTDKFPKFRSIFFTLTNSAGRKLPYDERIRKQFEGRNRVVQAQQIGAQNENCPQQSRSHRTSSGWSNRRRRLFDCRNHQPSAQWQRPWTTIPSSHRSHQSRN